MSRIIAVLAVQGAFLEHEARFRSLGYDVIELRQLSDLEQPFDGLVLPGGESTAQGKIMRDLGMHDVLRDRIEAGLPVFGTCAGVVLLAQNIEGAGDLEGLDMATSAVRTHVDGFATIPITVQRNGYGRQLGSFKAEAGFRNGKTIPAVFIRAPRITRLGDDVEVIATLDEEPIAVRYGNQIACTFHPELTRDNTLFNQFIRILDD